MAAEHNWHPDYDEEQGRIIESCFDCGVSRECYPDMKPHYRRQPYLEPADLETLQMILSELNPMFSRHAALRAIIAKCEGKP